MGIFDRFPSTKLNDVNLDWILKKIRALRGGTTNQVLAKASNDDFDFKWVTGGGGGGTSDYNDLVNQPQINNITLVGNKSASDLGLLGTGALSPYRTAAAQDAIDATKQAKITASGMLKGDGNGGVTAATAGTDYLAPSALLSYRTAAAQDAIDEAQNAQISALSPQITARAKADEIGIVITGAMPAMIVSAGQYVIVRNSTIAGIADGLYTAVNALSPGTNVTAADLAAVTKGGLNDITNSVSGTPAIEAGATASYSWYRTYGKLVYVSFNFKKASGELPTGTVFLSGFPVPEATVNTIVVSGLDAVQNIQIETDGTLIVDGRTVSTDIWYGGSCMYIMA